MSTYFKYIRNCAILFCVFACGLYCQGQEQDQSLYITMTDTLDYTDFGISEIADMRYLPSDLFDGKVNTCWVSNTSRLSTRKVYVRIPETPNDSILLNIFPGYGKSKSLYVKNSRPRELTLSFFSAYIPDGYVSENHYLCKAFKLPDNQHITLEDRFGIQQFRLKYTRSNFIDFASTHSNDLNFPVLDTFTLLQMDVTEIYSGSKYEQDICISELFFDDCYTVIPDKKKAGEISDIFLSEDENELWITKNDKNTRIYIDNASVLQIVQTSILNEWAIILALPADTEGRVEANYLLFDLRQEELINSKLTQTLPAYIPGEPLYLEEKEGKTFLKIDSLGEKDYMLELR